ncbi:MAG TPA: ABC transporter permease [Candidatus Limnocylindrales bacterium]|nr:ABC transporter permease [Candidatus Limnocylindrales bacterium]
MNLRYLMLEARVIARNSRFLIFTLIMPAVLFVIYVGLWGGLGATYRDGTPVALSLMVSMSGYGAMSAAMTTGMGIAIEREYGWMRQLRLTPMSGLSYLLAKATLSMIVALPTILVVSLLGLTFGGVRLTGPQWLGVTLGMWLACSPFAAIGVAMGQLSTADSAQAIGGASMMTLGLAGGMWIPSQIVPEWAADLMKLTPSFWLRQVGQSVVNHALDLRTAILVLAAWTAVATAIAARRYRSQLARA